MSTPYTHDAHALACCHAARAGIVLCRKYVQVRRRQVTYCATILEAVTVGNVGDCWTVDTLWPEQSRMTVLVRYVTDCESAGGGCCVCAKAEAAARSGSEDGRFRFCATREARGISQAGVVAPPESLTHETTPVSAGS